MKLNKNRLMAPKKGASSTRCGDGQTAPHGLSVKREFSHSPRDTSGIEAGALVVGRQAVPRWRRGDGVEVRLGSGDAGQGRFAPRGVFRGALSN
jgi:hypothetical protein